MINSELKSKAIIQVKVRCWRASIVQ